METGLILALFSSVVFAAGIVLVRRTAAAAGESFSITAASIFVGIPFFALAVIFSGEWKNLVEISVKALIMLAAAGLIHFIVGRLVAYEAFRLIGANRSTTFTQTSPIYTMILSFALLRENFTWFIGFGALCMLVGAFLVTQEKRSFTGEEKKRLSREEIKGILLALGAALCWGITPVLIKPSVEEMGSSSAGSFVSYAAASIVMALLMLRNNRWHNFVKLPFKQCFLPMIIAAVFTATGQLLYFTSLEKSPANVIAPLMSIQLLFVLIFSYLLNRRIELFTPKVIAGTAATIAGTVLLFL